MAYSPEDAVANGVLCVGRCENAVHVEDLDEFVADHRGEIDVRPRRLATNVERGLHDVDEWTDIQADALAVDVVQSDIGGRRFVAVGASQLSRSADGAA